MNQAQINKQIFRRIEKLEKWFLIINNKIKSNRDKKELKTDDKISLPNLILKLRDSGFFKQPKGAGEVYKKLLPTYSCKIDRINMALKRLKERKELRITDKIIKGKKVLAYVW